MNRWTQVTVAAMATVAVAVALVAQQRVARLPDDRVDLAAGPLDPHRGALDRHTDTVLRTMRGDPGAFEELRRSLTPQARTSIDDAAIRQVVAFTREELPLQLRGVSKRTPDTLDVLLQLRSGPVALSVATVTGTGPTGPDTRIVGLLLTPAQPGRSPLGAAELALLAAAGLLMIGLGLSRSLSAPRYLAAGAATVGSLAELTPWAATQTAALFAVPAALVGTVGALRLGRAALAATAVAAAGSLLPLLAVDTGGFAAPAHLWPVPALVGHSAVLSAGAASAALAAALVVAGALVRRYLTSARAGRRALVPVTVGALAGCAAVIIVASSQLLHPATIDLTPSGWLAVALLAAAAGQVAARVRRRYDLSDVATMVADLGTARSSDLSSLLGRALDDPGARLVYWTGARYVTPGGDAVVLPASPRAYTLLKASDEPLGAVLHDPAVHVDPERVYVTCAAIRLALENERLTARTRAQLSEVRASRARLLHAEQTAQARLERDLHDGAQQRLTAALLAVRMVQARQRPTSPAVAAELEPIVSEIAAAIQQIRELARGVRPAILDHGLTAAVDSLAELSPVPVTVHSDGGRCPADIETIAYFVVSEALTNIANHARATHAEVRITTSPALLRLVVTDDGRGGARAGTGSGLTGVVDRVDACGGRVELTSAPGAGTTITMELPCR
ncbi:MAG: hypothetical protein HYR62_10390 [Actinobacteria bacterium]|nr:hypothetical protein [Actinomycetota bacterium]MBI3686348.1 hypothetical protein [Actinomycetota bacterium]